MAKGIYERKGRHGDVTYYIRYQVDLTDIKERVGRKSRGFTREMAKDALKARLGGGCSRSVQSRKSAQACTLFQAGGALPGVCRRLQARMGNREIYRGRVCGTIQHDAFSQHHDMANREMEGGAGEGITFSDGEPALDGDQAYVSERRWIGD